MIKIKPKRHDLASSPEHLRKIQALQRQAGKDRLLEKLRGSRAASE